jgi:hypothetical protein
VTPEDTADVASLPAVPQAVSVETVTVAEASDTMPEAAPVDDLDVASAPVADHGLSFERPEHVRGIYLSAWAAGSSRRSTALLELAARTEINSFVIDIKDVTGFVSHRTRVPMAHELGATEEVRIRDLSGLLSRLAAQGVYPIARIVVVKDPLFAAGRPELAVQDSAGGVWVDGKNIIWMNPYSREVWEYHVALAREVAEMGFPEIQWDYVRFPDAPRSELERAVYPGADGVAKADAIRSFLQYSRDELSPLGVAVSADVFGVTTSVSRDVGIGQVWESFIDVVDVALPMVYPSHYWEGSFGIEDPNAHPYEIVKRALSDAVERSAKVEGAGLTRPWLQDFTLGPPAYGSAEVRAQIQATYDAGLHEWILWNPSSRYTEGALEPTGGFPEEPMIRVSNEVVPVGERWAYLRGESPEVDGEEASAPDSAATTVELPDTTTAGELPDTTAAGVPPGDTVQPGPLLPDTVTDDAPAPDTVTDGAPRPDTLAAPVIRPGTAAAGSAGAGSRRVP